MKQILNRPNLSRAFQPEDYILHSELQNAVEVAIALGQPLLLTGEPGTGKTKLAWKVAHELAKDKKASFSAEPFIFNTKTSSTARDLFYTYDAIAHFQTANIKRENAKIIPKTADFIELQALGKAIALTNVEQIDRSKFATVLPSHSQNSVVLIDEIDKAPRDFTNDILHEIENYTFQIREQNNHTISRSEQHQIVVIMTSNSEKNLPDAFLRRCVFYHIPFPTPDTLLKIVQKQVGSSTKYTELALKPLLKIFDDIRAQSVRKKPATAELISWLRILEMKQYLAQDEAGQKEMLLQNLSVLVKTREDLEMVRKWAEKR